MIKKHIIRSLVILILIITLVGIVNKKNEKSTNNYLSETMYDSETGLYYIKDKNTRRNNYSK